jgi:hypothetical protein
MITPPLQFQLLTLRAQTPIIPRKPAQALRGVFFFACLRLPKEAPPKLQGSLTATRCAISSGCRRRRRHHSGAFELCFDSCTFRFDLCPAHRGSSRIALLQLCKQFLKLSGQALVVACLGVWSGKDIFGNWHRFPLFQLKFCAGRAEM